MALDFTREGYEAGQASASIARKAIKDAGRSGLAALCGRSLEEKRKRQDAAWEVKHSNSWAVGYFNGFLDRAENILAGQ